MEVVSRIGRGREPSDERGHGQQHDFAHAPQREPRAKRRIGAGRRPGKAALISADERERRGKRHLEARMDDRFGHQQHDRKRRNRDGPHGKRRPVDHDTDQDHRDHDEGALRFSAIFT